MDHLVLQLCFSLAARFQPDARPLIPMRRSETSQKKKAPCKKHDALVFYVVCDQLVCWIADNSQAAPGRRAKVQTSVASPGCSLPATTAPVLRSSVLSVSAKRSATVAYSVSPSRQASARSPCNSFTLPTLLTTLRARFWPRSCSK